MEEEDKSRTIYSTQL